MTAHARLPRAARQGAALALVVACGVALAGTAAAPPASQPARPLSEAEKLLFMQPHLARIEAPRTLRYRYVREGGGEARFEDDVTMAFARTADGSCCAVHGTYLSGARTVTLPDVDQARANPLLLYFLEHQVRDLQRRTGGTANHFRQRIRLALADAATVSATTIRPADRELAARTVRIAPFLDDPYRARFERDAATEYSFVLSDAVPGVFYQLRAALPDGGTMQTLTLVDETERPPDRR
jgi:hypothetical protein